MFTEEILNLNHFPGPTTTQRRFLENHFGRVLGPRSGGTTGAALGQGLGLSSMTSAAGPQARLQAQAITNLGPIYWNDPSWLFGILGICTTLLLVP